VPRAELDKTPLSYYSDYWFQLGTKVKPRLVRVGPQRIAGLVVGPELVVSTVESADREGSPSASGGPDPGAHRLLAADAIEGLALFQFEAPFETTLRPADPTSFHPGMLVAGVTVNADDRLEVMPGHLISVGDASRPEPSLAQDSLDVFLPLRAPTGAVAIVDLDGDLVGAAFRSPGRTRFLSAPSLMGAVERLRARPACRSIEVADLHGSVRTLLALDEGVAVRRVERGAFSATPALRAGDVLLEWNGHRVSSAAEFLRLQDGVRPGAVVPHLTRRGPHLVRGKTVMPGPDCRPVAEPPMSLPRTGLTLAWDTFAVAGERPSSAWRVSDIVPGSAAQAAGIQAGDRILGADGSGPDREAVQRGMGAFEKRGRPIVVTLQRRDRIELVALAPAQDRGRP
jgi:S1-C subfamily serine protease